MECFIKYENTEYQVKVSLKRLLKLLSVDKTEAEIEQALLQAVKES